MRIEYKDKFIGFGKAAKLDKKDIDFYNHLKDENPVPPKFGFAWWFWIPSFRKTSLGFDFFWLCFYLYYDNCNKAKYD